MSNWKEYHRKHVELWDKIIEILPDYIDAYGIEELKQEAIYRLDFEDIHENQCFGCYWALQQEYGAENYSWCCAVDCTLCLFENSSKECLDGVYELLGDLIDENHKATLAMRVLCENIRDWPVAERWKTDDLQA